MKTFNQNNSKLLDIGGFGGNKYRLFIEFGSSKLTCKVFDKEGGSTESDFASDINDNNWYHLAWVIERPNAELKCNWKMYLNGSEVKNSPAKNMNYPPFNEDSGHRIAHKNITIGGTNYWANPHYNGGIGDVRIYKTPLTKPQVCYVYRNPDPDIS